MHDGSTVCISTEKDARVKTTCWVDVGGDVIILDGNAFSHTHWKGRKVSNSVEERISGDEKAKKERKSALNATATE